MKAHARDFSSAGRSCVMASKGAVATSHPLSTATALQILKEGGNAVDAAIAAVATQCVVEPHMTGIGGDCFVIVAEPNGTVHGLNGSGRSAKAAHLDWYLENGFTDIPDQSAHSVTVPGAIKAWETLHAKLGSMDFTRLFADAIHYAEEGFPITARVAHDWQAMEEALLVHEGSRLHNLKDGKAPNAADKWAFPALGRTLHRIATQGSISFYEGEIAEEIARTVQAGGGFLSEDDLAGVTADWVGTISTDVFGATVHQIPPNGQGITALILMRLLEKLGLPDDPDGAARAHLQIEAARLAYLVRDHEVADPETMTATAERLLSDAYIDALAGQFDPTRRNPDLSLPDPKGSDTVYLSVVDENGLAVSFINSLFAGFGSKIVTKNSGIALQNRGCGFVIKKDHPNAIGPHKRPMHTIIPSMVIKNDKPVISFGVMGGQYQPMGQAHVLANMMHYGMDPQQALDHPRYFWNDTGEIALESGVSSDVQKTLTGLGHKTVTGGLHGGGQVIAIDPVNQIRIAGSDPRKDGHAAGY